MIKATRALTSVSEQEVRELVQREAGHLPLGNAGRPVIAWDIDGTLARTAQRAHLVPRIAVGTATWADYELACGDDELIEGTAALMRALTAFRHVAISGRSTLVRELTWTWARQHSLPLDAVILRPAGHEVGSGPWKARVLDLLADMGLDVVLAFEDWAPAATVIRERTGIPVVGINPFDDAAAQAMELTARQHLEREAAP